LLCLKASSCLNGFQPRTSRLAISLKRFFVSVASLAIYSTLILFVKEGTLYLVSKRRRIMVNTSTQTLTQRFGPKSRLTV
jgi:hypothetical protein